MPLIDRVVIPACPHHVTQRGNHSQDVFFSDGDRRVYLSILRDYCRRHGLRVLAWCLMSNHVHLVLVPEREESLSNALGRTHNDYARWLHVRQRRSGHLWQNRFYSCPLDDAHLKEALRYVELNPVRAGLVAAAVDWPWSSATAHCGGEDQWGLLDLAWWRERFEFDWWATVLNSGFQEAQINARLREATRTGRPLGSEEFTIRLERETGRCLRPQRRGPKPKALAAAQLSFGNS